VSADAPGEGLPLTAIRRTNPASIAPPIGKYSHLSEVPPSTRLVFIAGQVGMSPDGELAADSYAQTLATFRNVGRLLDSLGAAPEHLVRLLTFVNGSANLPGFYAARDEVYAEWFPGGDYPGHSLAVVAGLADPALTVEMEGWAALPC
jgi:enamine deaminase RidA (YjgF/YER057c/UK114 family)